MVMPIADAVLQQLICTGMADYFDDSGTIDTQDEESGESKRQSENGGYACIMFILFAFFCSFTGKEENQKSSNNHLQLQDRKDK